MFAGVFKFLKHKKFLGIDIGTSAIRVVEVGTRGPGGKLENYGECHITFSQDKPFRVFEKDTLQLSDKEAAETISAICKQAGIRTREVNFSIPDFSSFFTNFQLPAMSKQELEHAVTYEVRPYIPLPLSEIRLDWAITEGEVSKGPVKILAVAIPNEVVTQYQEIARMANLKIHLLEPEVFALARSSVTDESAKKIVGLIDVGARSTTCSILDRGVLKVSHSFNLGGNELTDVLAKSLNIDYAKSEVGKKKYGLSTDPAHNLKNIFLPFIDSILEEIKKVFREFYQNEGKEIERIILAGGTALLPGLKEYIAPSMGGKEIVLADPFKNMVFPAVLKNTLVTLGPSYAVAVGLALRGLK